MSNLVGETLHLQLTTASIEKIGNINGSENLQKFYVDCLKNIKKYVSLKQKEELERIAPYLANAIFLPNIISTMIENNITYPTAVEICEQDIYLKLNRLTDTLKRLDIKKNIEQISIIFAKYANIHPNNENPEYVVNTSLTITERIYNSILKSNLVFFALSFSSMKSVKTVLDEHMINPIKNKYLSQLEEHKESLGLDNMYLSFITSALDSEIEKIYITYPLQSIISTVLIKAIDEQITFTEAATCINFEEIKNAVDKDLKELENMTEDDINVIIDSLDNL